MIILITASLFFQKCNSMASKWEGFAPVTTWSTSDNSSLSRLPCLFVLVLVCGVLALNLIWRRVSRARTLGRMQHFCNQVPKIKREYSVHAKSSIQRDNFRFCWTVWYWSLFLALPTCRNECSTSEDTQKFLPRLMQNQQGLQSLNLGTIPINNAVPYYPHGKIVCGHLCDECMEIRRAKRLSQALCLFRNSSCKFVYGPKNVRSTNSDHIKAFQDNLCAWCGQFSDRLKFFHFEVVGVQTAQPTCLPVHNIFLRTFFARPSMSQDQATVFAWGFAHRGFFQLCFKRNSWFEHFLCLPRVMFSFDLQSR